MGRRRRRPRFDERYVREAAGNRTMASAHPPAATSARRGGRGANRRSDNYFRVGTRPSVTPYRNRLRTRIDGRTTDQRSTRCYPQHLVVLSIREPHLSVEHQYLTDALADTL